MYSTSSRTRLSSPSPFRSSTNNQNRLPSVYIDKIPHFSRRGNPSPGGLRTPPTDEMGTTYQLPNLASYETHPLHHHSSFAPSMAQQDRTRSAVVDSVYHSASKFPSETQQLSLPHPRTSSTAFAPAAPHSARSVSSRHSAESSTPGSGLSLIHI